MIIDRAIFLRPQWLPGLEMSPVDICIIFANALDNAIEACEQCKEKRYIHMRIKRTAAFYCIVLENSMKTQEKAFGGAIPMACVLELEYIAIYDIII